MTAPIVPPYLARRARVTVIFEREIAEAEHGSNHYVAAALLQLRNEVLAALDPDITPGGDSRS